MQPIIIPSILNCDVAKLKKDLILLFQSGVTHLHFDVMDGSLTPDSFNGFEYISLLSDILEEYNIVKNVHLITTSPQNYLSNLREHKVDQISFHINTLNKPEIAVIFNKFKDQVNEVGVVIDISESENLSLLKMIDFAHICNKNHFSKESYSANQIAVLISSIKPVTGLIQIDGGVTAQNIKFYEELGAIYLISGGGVFTDDPVKSFTTLKELINIDNDIEGFL